VATDTNLDQDDGLIAHLDLERVRGNCIIEQSGARIIGVLDKDLTALLVSAYYYRLATI
jgi:hypothetical protein